jgi:cytochrome b561
MTDQSAATYKGAAIALHWIIALAIIGQIGLAWYMGSLPEDSPAQDAIMPWHISIGLTILLLSVIRLAVRLTNPPPPLPAEMPAWERFLANATHILFYVLIIGIPLVGWMMPSLIKPQPILFWGLPWPHLPWFVDQPREVGEPLFNQIETIHGTVLVWTLIGLWVLHVAGALKHQFDGHPVLYRMIPFLPKPRA